MSTSKFGEVEGKDWLKYSKSWKAYKPGARSNATLQHPAKFPEELCRDTIAFFTKPGEAVFDPFMGTGTAPMIAESMGRIGVGVELDPKWWEQVKCTWKICADTRSVVERFLDYPAFANLVLTSPPYWDMLSKSRGNSRSQSKNREKDGLPITYGVESDLVSLPYWEFVAELGRTLAKTMCTLVPTGHMVVVLQNFMDKEEGYCTLAWDLVSQMRCYEGIEFVGEKLWLQEDKQLGIWGFPSRLVINIHHHYLLIFRWAKGQDGEAGPTSGDQVRRASWVRGVPTSGRGSRKGSG